MILPHVGEGLASGAKRQAIPVQCWMAMYDGKKWTPSSGMYLPMARPLPIKINELRHALLAALL